MILPTYFKGHILIAVPSLADPNFQYSVTCISEHNDQGAMGIVINRRQPELDLKMILDELKINHDDKAATTPIHIGGPVHVNELFILHGHPLEKYEGMVITDSLAMSNSKAILEAIALGQGPEDYFIALGCAGWGPGQLEWELGQNAWLTGDINPELLFKTPVDNRWRHAIEQLGIDPALLIDQAGHA